MRDFDPVGTVDQRTVDGAILGRSKWPLGAAGRKASRGRDATSIDAVGMPGFAMLALDHMSQAVAIFDARPRLLYCNSAAVKLLQLSPELCRTGASFRRIMQHQVECGALAAGEIPKLLGGIKRKQSYRLEYQDSNGTVVSVRRDPLTSGGFVILYNDVTLQRRAEAALQENERRYYAVVEDQTDLIARFTPEREITFVNNAFCQFYQLPRDRILDRDILDFVPTDDRAAVGAYFQRPGSGRKRPRSMEHRALLDREGQPRWLQRSDRPIYGAHNRIIEYQSVMRDVTELKRAQEHAQRTNKLTTLGQIVAGVTHELNQPLNAASLAAQNALMDIEDRGTVDVQYMTQKLTSLADSLQRMGAIVNHLRTFIRPPAESSTATDVAETVRRAVEFVSHQTDFDTIDFKMNLPQACRPVAAAAVDVEIVLVNLFANARDAIAKRDLETAGGRAGRGRITIDVRDAQKGPMVLMRVRDNGGGIPEDLIPRVFDPFFTTKDVGAGMGLGLAIVHQTVTNLGGALAVRNSRGGAEFRISIPVVG